MPATNVALKERASVGIDPVEAALPRGQKFQLPEEWREALANRDEWYESPSSVRNFAACPLRWYLERYSDLPSSPSGLAAIVGTFVHRILEVFYSEPAHLRTNDLLMRTFRTAWDAIKQGAVTGIIPADLQAEFDGLIETANNEDGMMGAFYKRARVSIEAVPDFDPDPAKVNIVSNEKWVRMKSNGITIRGKIDRITGTVVADYKTGRAPAEDDVDVLVDEDGEPILDDDGYEIYVLSDAYIPIGMYALMATRGNKQDGSDGQLITAMSLLYLSQNVKYNIKVRRTTLAMVQRFVDRVTEEMNNVAITGEIMASPAAKPDEGQCGWCPASGMCPIWTDGTFTKMREELGI